MSLVRYHSVIFSLSLFLFLAVHLDYLLSNNHVNSIIVLKLDFSDEEVLAYYISFLKTLSFKLNKHTIHFFYNEVRGRTTRTLLLIIIFTISLTHLLLLFGCQLAAIVFCLLI